MGSAALVAGRIDVVGWLSRKCSSKAIIRRPRSAGEVFARPPHLSTGTPVGTLRHSSKEFSPELAWQFIWQIIYPAVEGGGEYDSAALEMVRFGSFVPNPDRGPESIIFPCIPEISGYLAEWS